MSTMTYTQDQAELEKNVATKVQEGDRFLCIDNIKFSKPVESAVLERIITDMKPSFRRLGTNSSIHRSTNDLLFCLTMNNTMLGKDMRRRSLPINLYVDEHTTLPENAMNEPREWLVEHYLELVAELVGMVHVWIEAGKPSSPSAPTHSTSGRWAATIDAILQANGIRGFLVNYESSMLAFDREYKLLLEICRQHHNSERLTGQAWALKLSEGVLEDRFKDSHGKPRSAQAQSTIVGLIFQARLKQRLQVDGRGYELRRAFPDGPTHSAVYWFEKVTD